MLELTLSNTGQWHKHIENILDEGSLPEIVQYGPSSRFKCLTASKGSNNYFYLLLLQLVLCRVAALKSLPVHHP